MKKLNLKENETKIWMLLWIWTIQTVMMMATRSTKIGMRFIHSLSFDTCIGHTKYSDCCLVCALCIAVTVPVVYQLFDFYFEQNQWIYRALILYIYIFFIELSKFKLSWHWNKCTFERKSELKTYSTRLDVKSK